MKLIAHDEHLEYLTKWYAGRSDRAGLLMLYGRPRLGKHTLIAEWLRRRKITSALYWVPPYGNGSQQYRAFCEALNAFANMLGLTPKSWSFSNQYADWKCAFEFVGELAKATSQPLLFILDDFERCGDENGHAAWGLKAVWDHQLQHIPNLRIALMSSHPARMIQEVLSYSAPLYGRATGIFEMQPMFLGNVHSFLPHWTTEDRIAAYALTGGVGGYLAQLMPAQNFKQAVQEIVLDERSDFLQDAEVMLQTFAPDPAMSATVLSAISCGQTIWEEVRDVTQLGPKKFRKAIHWLQLMGWVREHYPLLKPMRDTNARLAISDGYLHFYFSLIAPNLSHLRQGKRREVAADILAKLPMFIHQNVFKNICLEWLVHATMRNQIDLWPDAFGSFELNGSREINLDASAIDRRQQRVFFGSAHWQQPKNTSDTNDWLCKLIEDAKQVSEVASGWQRYCGCFVPHRVSPKAKSSALERSVHLVDVFQIEDDLVKPSK